MCERIFPYLAINDTTLRDELTLNFLSLIMKMSPTTRQRALEIGHLIHLPHHVSTKEEVDILMEKFSSYLFSLVRRWGLPTCVTIARSAEIDTYTPANQVDEIQQAVINIIDIVFKNQYGDSYGGDTLQIHNLSIKSDDSDVFEKCLTLFVSKACKRYLEKGMENCNDGGTGPNGLMDEAHVERRNEMVAAARTKDKRLKLV